MIIKDEIKIRLAFESEYDQINELYNKVYCRDRVFKCFEWEYIHNSLNKAYLWVAVHSGNIIGHYALIPLRMCHAGHEFIGAKGESIIVDPNYRKQGIGSSIIMTALDLNNYDNLSLIWGFPNEKSFNLMSKYGRIYIGNLENNIKLVNPFFMFKKNNGIINKEKSLHASNFHFTIDGKLIVCDIDVDKQIDELWNKEKKYTEYSISRNSAFINWRFKRNPYNNYLYFYQWENYKEELLGYAICNIKKERKLKVAYIVDIFLAQQAHSITKNMIIKIINILKEQKIDFIFFLLNNKCNKYKNVFSKILKKNIFIPKRNKQFSVLYDFSRHENLVVENLQNWYITGAFAEGIEF